MVRCSGGFRYAPPALRAYHRLARRRRRGIAMAEVAHRWELLTETGAGTPMGELLRRYWWPIAGASEFDNPGTKPVRLMGEDLVLYKDLGGRYGLLDRHCRHRRA